MKKKQIIFYTLTLKFPSPILHVNSIKDRIFKLTRIPTQHQRLVTGCRHLNDEKSAIKCSSEDGTIFPSVRLLLRLKAGKGRVQVASTRGGNKSGVEEDKQFRCLNAEKRLKGWKAGEEERRLEKVAEEFLKKQMKKAEVALSVKEALPGKRKSPSQPSLPRDAKT